MDLIIESSKNLTIKPGAFQNLNTLSWLEIYGTSIKRIEKEAFEFDNKSNHIYWSNIKL